MKKIYTLIVLLLCGMSFAQAPVFEVAEIQHRGDSEKFINLVIMGDGYTAAEQDTFLATASDISNYLFSISPWAEYKDYFNVYAIKVIAGESGVKHANTALDCTDFGGFTEVSNPINYFGTRFDGYGIHRLTIVTNNSRVVNVLNANFPNYDQVFIVGNSPHYGGSGGAYAVFSANVASNEIAAHEIGHSFAGLADEYYAGDQYFAEKANMTQQSDPTLIKWKNWITDTGDIEIIPYGTGGEAATWFKPTNFSCKMEQLNSPYCSVCKEGIIEKIHSLVNTIVAFTPDNSTTINTSSTPINFELTELMKPIPNTLHIKWQLDTTVSDTNNQNFQIDPVTLTNGLHTLTASVVDESPLVRTDNHATVHISTVTWSINKTNLGIHTNATTSKAGLRLYPNPSGNLITFNFDLEKPSTIAIDIVTMDGKTVLQSQPKQTNSGQFEETLSIENLAAGTYIAVMKMDGIPYTKSFVKE